MTRTTIALLLFSTALITSPSYGQEFWYAPAGLDYGSRAGINLGYGVGFGYGIGVGLSRNQGAAFSPVFQGGQSGSNPYDYLQESANSLPDVMSPISPSRAEKQMLLQQSLVRKQAMEQRREAAREAARLRNARYFKYLEEHRSNSASDVAAD